MLSKIFLQIYHKTGDFVVSVNHFVIQNVKRDNSPCIIYWLSIVDEEECHLREQVFEFVRNVIQLKLTESQLALFSAVVLIRAGQCWPPTGDHRSHHCIITANLDLLGPPCTLTLSLSLSVTTVLSQLTNHCPYEGPLFGLTLSVELK